MGMFDMFVKDSVIENAKKDKMMNEICEFKRNKTDVVFQGTFIDALEYIQENFKG